MRKSSFAGSHSRDHLLLCLILGKQDHISGAGEFRSERSFLQFSSDPPANKKKFTWGVSQCVASLKCIKKWCWAFLPSLTASLLSGPATPFEEANSTSYHQGRVIIHVQLQASCDIVQMKCQLCVITEMVSVKQVQPNTVMFVYRSGAQEVRKQNETCSW